MSLIRHGRLENDPWVTVGDGEEIVADRPIIVSLQRWQAERVALEERERPLGLRLASDQSPTLVADDLDQFDVIALEFPKFTDGRAYSYARLLRERYGYAGEVRAVGNVLRDQLLFMHRCGFDAFEIIDTAALDSWIRAISEISVWYQPASDGRDTVAWLRHRRHAAARAVGERRGT